MIVRALRLRHGRLALPKPPTPSPIRRLRRSFSQQPFLAAQQRIVPLNDPNHPVAQDYAFHQHQKYLLQNLGADVPQHYKPHELVNHPPSPADITLELLIASQSHLGHATSLWHPANAQYIFGIRGEHDPIHIISPDVTAAHLRRACKVVSGVAERGGLVLFVGTRAGQDRCVVKAAELAKGCHLFTKWIPGSITNGQQILGRCEKKVVNEHDEEVTGFEDQLGAKAALKPDLVVCLNPLENYVLLHECGLNNIPTIGIIDTDVNPTWVTYPIAANDDSLRCVQVIAGVLGNAGREGQERRLEKAKKGIVEYGATHGLTAPQKMERKPKRQMKSRIPTRQEVAAQQAGEPGFDPAAPSEEYVGAEEVSDLQRERDQALLDEAAETIREEGEVAAAQFLHDDEEYRSEPDDFFAESSQEEPGQPTATATATGEPQPSTPLQRAQLDPATYQTPTSPLLRKPVDFNLWSLGEPGLQPKYTSDPSQEYKPQPRSVAGPKRPAPIISDAERTLSERDEAGQTTEYAHLASASSGPRKYPAPKQVLEDPVTHINREVSEQERELSGAEIETDGTWAEHDESLAARMRRLARQPIAFDGDLNVDGPGGQQLDYALESAGVPLAGLSVETPANTIETPAESTWEQVADVAKELGESNGQGAAPKGKGPTGVAPEPPIVGRGE